MQGNLDSPAFRSALLRSIRIEKQLWIARVTKFSSHVEQTRGNNSPHYAWSQGRTWVNPQAAMGRCLPFQVSLATSHFVFAYTRTFGFQVILPLPLPLLTSISIQLQQVRTHRSQIVGKKLYLISLPFNHLQRFQEIKDMSSLRKVIRLQRSLTPMKFPVLVQMLYQYSNKL